MSDVVSGETPFMHIYGQPAWHDEAIIVLNTNALLAMKKAIEEALETGVGKFLSFQGDGEGYDTIIVKKDDDGLFLHLAAAYTDEIAKERGDDLTIWPWDLPEARELMETEIKADDPEV